MKKFLWIFLTVGLVSTIVHVLALYHVLPAALTYSDVALFAGRATSSGWFYFGKNIEYPVLTGMFVQLMGFLSGGSKALYVIWSSLGLVGLGAGATYYLYEMLPEGKKSSLWIYWVLAPSMLIFMTYNFDMLVLFEVVLAFYLMKKNRPLAASAVLALGFSTKLYPIIYLLPFLMHMKDNRERLRAIGAFALTAFVVNIFFIVGHFDGWNYFYVFNSQRGYNLDSMWTVIMPWLKPLYDLEVLNIAAISVFTLTYFFVLRKYRQVDLVRLCFWLTILYAVTTKVFSPQHLLWLLPFFVLLREPAKKWYYSLEAANVVIIWFVLYFNFIPNPEVHRVVLLMEPFTVLRFIFLLVILFFSMQKYETIEHPVRPSVVWEKTKIFIRKYRHAMAAVFFVIVTIFMTWPLATKLTNSYPSTFTSFGGDPNLYISYMDLVVKKIEGKLPTDLNRMLFYPAGVNISGGYEGPIMLVAGVPIILLTHNPILAYNLILLSAFVLTCLACYFLILYLTDAYAISVLCGFCFGFSTYMIVRGLQHLDLLFLFTVPFMVLMVLKFLEGPNYKNIFYLSLSVLLAALSAWYYLVGGVMFMGLAFLTHYDKFLQAKKMFVYAMLGVVLAVMLPALPLLLNNNSQIVKNAGVIVDRAGAVPASFLLPHAFTVVWGWMTDGIYKKFPSVYDQPYPYFEQTSYYGIIGLIAAVVLIFFRNKIPIPKRSLWVSAFLVFMILAMGTAIQFGKWEITMPFAVLRLVFPFNHLRAPNRFFVFSYLAAVVIFAYFLLEVRKHIQPKNLKLLLGCLLVLALFSERFIFPYPTVSLPVSEFYQKLGHDKDDFAIVDVPIASSWGDSLYNYYQVFHGKPIVGGEYFWTSYDSHTFDYIQKNQFLFNTALCLPDMGAVDPAKSLPDLAAQNIRFVVVHNFLLHDDTKCPQLLTYVRKFFTGRKPYFSDGEITVYSTLDKLPH